MRQFTIKIINTIRQIYIQLCSFICIPIIHGWYDDFWNYRNSILSKPTKGRNLYYTYLMKYNAFVGLNTKIKQNPILPHGLNGIHISDAAIIGEGCIILQQVTIGSNTLQGSKNYGAPTIGNNVFIDAGAKIIGNVHIGNNCRIGANCVVTKDMPDNSTAVIKNIEIILHKDIRDNKYQGITPIL